MADDDTTTTIDELFELASEEDELGAEAEEESDAPAEPLSIDDFLAAYDEPDPAPDAGDAAPAGEVDEADEMVDLPDGTTAADDDDAAPEVGDDEAATDVGDVVEAEDDVDLLALVAATAEQLRVAAAERAAEEAATAATEPATVAPEPEAGRQEAPLPTAAVDPFTSTSLGAETPTGLLLQYPSRDFPPPPVVRLEVPTGWLGTALPDCEMAARGPEEIDGMYPTVVMRVRRVAAAAARDDSLTRWMGLATDDDAEIISDELRSDATAPARRLLVRRTASDGRVARSRHLFVYVPATEHIASVVSIAATWPESADAELGRRLTDVLSSVRIFMPQRGR